MALATLPSSNEDGCLEVVVYEPALPPSDDGADGGVTPVNESKDLAGLRKKVARLDEIVSDQ